MLKKRLPFRLGTTSYVIPDDIVANVRFLADQVDDVEIVLFDSDGQSNIPSTEEVSILKVLAKENDLTFTIHLPIDLHTGHAEAAERRRAVDSCRRIISRMRPVDPFAYILHLNGDRRGRVPANDLAQWREFHRQSIQDLLLDVAARDLCVENLDYPFELVSGIVREFELSVCIDIGHLLMTEQDLHAHLDHYLSITRVVHLHGIWRGTDHQSVQHLDARLLGGLLSRFAVTDTVERAITLEIFSAEEFQDSIQCIVRWLAEASPA